MYQEHNLLFCSALENRHHEDEWLCEWISVAAGADEVKFPVYDWIKEEKEVTTGKGGTQKMFLI